MSKDTTLCALSKTIKGTIHLPGSKSESNRALILQALSDGQVHINNLSQAEDTATLRAILQSSTNTWDVGPAGTAMRFLTAFAALKSSNITLTGSVRMQVRPIGILVDALKQLGADIIYTDKQGYPPLHIQKALVQRNKQVNVPGNVSSQFVSALLLIAPHLPLGLELHIQGDVTSAPYIKMTLALLSQAGIVHQWNKQVISIAPQEFKSCEITIEPDWSAASYWYSLVALAQEAKIFLPQLSKNSLQGDCRIIDIMAQLGVKSEFKNAGLLLTKTKTIPGDIAIDFKDCPDLAQTVIVCCATLKRNAVFTGLETLRIKETDRIQALQNELAKIGATFAAHKQAYHLNCDKLHFPQKIHINTYHDHRMAMAFACLALVIPEVTIADKDVVTKSYPHFWDDLKSISIANQHVLLKP